MKILVTGANGFIGSRIASRYDRDHEVVAIRGSKQINLCDGDKVQELLQRRFDLIIHCAATGRNRNQIVDASISSANICMFMNIHANRHQFGRLINLGSGAEFDMTTDIDHAPEDRIYHAMPTASYGMSKNIIARLVNEINGYQTLRIFGCLDRDPPANTLMRRFVDSVLNGQPFELDHDRFFDWISMDDLLTVLDLAIDDRLHHKDINLVYPQKHLLSDILMRYCESQGIPISLIKTGSTSQLNYTGDPGKLVSLGLDLKGLDDTLRGLR